ncbi:MAG: hypothetical protein GY814_01150, partial [Gammaproteobacteria bacterium]|nr:hypothetical protein [Gammaproteobacteria bacterium]
MSVVNSLIKPVVVVGALVVGFGVAQAQQMMPQQGMMMPQQGMMMPQQGMMMPQQGMMQQQQMNPLAMLKLSDEQQKKLKDLAVEAKKQSAELVKLLGESARELPKLMADAKLDA